MIFQRSIIYPDLSVVWKRFSFCLNLSQVRIILLDRDHWKICNETEKRLLVFKIPPFQPNISMEADGMSCFGFCVINWSILPSVEPVSAVTKENTPTEPTTQEIWNMVRCLCFCNPSFINLKWACLGKINQIHSVFATCVSAPLLIDQSWNAVLCLFEMLLNILCLKNLQTREFSFLFVNFPGEDKVLYVSQT